MKHKHEEITHKRRFKVQRSKANATKYKMKWELKKKRRTIAKKSRSINARINKSK